MDPYITYEEYLELSTSNTPVSEEDFPKLLQSASIMLDAKTRYFYNNTDLLKDYPRRQNAFKLALVLQIDFYYRNGSTSTDESSQFQSVTVGRTSLSAGAGSSSKTAQDDMFSRDALYILLSVGLLYAGICTI